MTGFKIDEAQLLMFARFFVSLTSLSQFILYR